MWDYRIWFQLLVHFDETQHLLFLTARQHFLAVTDDDGLVRILEIPKTFYVRSRHEVRLTERHLIPAEMWIT